MRRRTSIMGCLMTASALAWCQVHLAARDEPERPPGKPRRAGQGVNPAEGNSFREGLYRSACLGAQWLGGMQRADGGFVYGWLPSLNRMLPDDNYLRQAGAALAVARAARIMDDADLRRKALKAQHWLLQHFEWLPENPRRLRPTLSPTEANPVGFSALVLLGLVELPQAPADIVLHAEALARFLASRQRPDGSLNVSASFRDDGEDAWAAIDFYPGEALYALALEARVRPQPWKWEVLARAFAFYRQRFQESPSTAFVPWQSAAFAELFLQTRDRRYADFVLEMNDWLLRLQYLPGYPAPASWIGGFGVFQDGRRYDLPPDMTTASHAESLVAACRVAKLARREEQWAQLTQRTELALRFLLANQYRRERLPYLADAYACQLDGAFHAGVGDGQIRIDFTQHAISAIFGYLHDVLEFDTALRLAERAPRDLQ